MICPNCKHRNSEEARFCENCGAKLTRLCPNCQSPVSPGAKFCSKCGFNLAGETDPALERLKRLVPKEFAERLLQTRGGAVERERRIVTILFCDVKGSTALGEERDPEEVMEIMNGAFDSLIEPVYRYEGTLARLMGDAILAFFGAPIAHEDDAVRAVLAALAIQDKLTAFAAQLEKTRGIKGFAVRVGINTGTVVVGEVGSDLRVEYTAMGDAINVASRLENAAAPGTIVISDKTARLVRHAFELKSLGGLELKGKAGPVQAYGVKGRKKMPESGRGLEGLESPLVGRERELQTLVSRVQALTRGGGQIVSVMGEAGLGKSRLIAELRKATAGENVQWLEARAMSYQAATPYAPFAYVLSRYFELRPEEPSPQGYEHIAARAAGLAPFLAALLGIEAPGRDAARIQALPPLELREEIFRAVVEFFRGLAATQPTVLVLEDLHWADSSSLDLAEHLMSLTDRAMLMLLALFRPRRQEPSWHFHELAARDYTHRYISVVLEPLDNSQARELVANLLHIEDLPEPVRALILEKAEGNPFFVEEVIRSLLDQKLVVRQDGHWHATGEIANLAVPETLAGVIMARLDQLDEDTKRVAQTASVIGREFQFDVLAEVHDKPAVLDASLSALQRRELVREKSRLPHPLYAYKHALTQETAYATILLSKRRELHRRVAECLERIEPDRVNEIAAHFLEGQVPARALPYLLAAGDRAAHAYSMPEAIQYFKDAVRLTPETKDVDLVQRAYEGLGRAYDMANDLDQAVKTYEEMDRIGGASDRMAMRISALNKISAIMGIRLGKFSQAEERLSQSEELCRQYQDRNGLAEMYMVRCYISNSTADFERALDSLNNSVRAGRELDVPEEVAFGKVHLANTLTFMTRFDEAWPAAQEARRLCEETGDRWHLAEALTSPFPLHYLRAGDLKAARQAAQEGGSLAAEIGNAFWEAWGWTLVGKVSQLRGEYEAAIAAYQRAARAGEISGAYAMKTTGLAPLAAVYAEIGVRLDESAALQKQVLEFLSDPARVVTSSQAWFNLGSAALTRGEVEQAREFFQKGLTIPSPIWLLERPRLLAGAALVDLKQKNLDEARSKIDKAWTFVQERAMNNEYPSVAWADGLVSAACGDQVRALEQFNRAESLAQEMQMRPLVWRARVGAARALASLNRPAEAEEKQNAARAMIDEIAGLFQDEKWRVPFVENARRMVDGES